MADAIRPDGVDALVDAVIDARATARPLAIRGGGSMAGFGRDVGEATALDLRGFAGVTDYDPAELVLTAGAGTPLAEVQRLVEGQGQALAFDPFDHGPLFGRGTGSATIGGAVAAAVAGSGRLSGGNARDHLLGFKGVTGRGDAITAGARVVKNVTGYDLPKLACGSRGRLFALTELTLRVVPAPREVRTLALDGPAFPAAVAAMAAAMGSAAEVAAAAYLPAGARTLLRLQGFGPSVAARAALLERLLVGQGVLHALAPEEAARAWDGLRTLAALPREAPLWRIAVAPSRAPALVSGLRGEWLADWAGGLVWLASEQPAETIRAAAAAAGGHATLVRGPAALRERVPALHPPAPGVAALEGRVTAAFDPDGVFDTGRFA